jgi:signal transduction histidine kinase
MSRSSATVARPETALLVVDDDPVVLEALRRELSARFGVVTARSGEEALELLGENRFDAVISDVRMPGMNGVELARRIGASANGPVRILLTGYADEDAIEAATAPGGVYRVTKPWGDELEIILTRALESRRAVIEAHSRLAAERAQSLEVAGRLERLAALGTLTAGVAHEMRSPLCYLQSNFEWLRDQLGELGGAGQGAASREELAVAIAECAEGVQRLTEILESIRTCTPASQSTPERLVSLTRCVETAVRLVRCRFKRGVKLEVKAGGAWWAKGHEGELSQIIVNLLINAAQAMNERGTVSVRITGADGRARVEVEDAGPGVPAEVVERLFEPFFTTKEAGAGTGLGLAISRDIARRHGGELRYMPRDGPGALFVLDLPGTTEPPCAE